MRLAIGWFGGKYYLMKYILPFPQHDIYVEPFGGSAVVLLNKVPCECEVYNDINERLVNFWQVLRKRYYDLKFLCKLKGSIDSRMLFEKYKEKSEDALEDAFRFFYVNRHSFSQIGNTYKGFTLKLSKNPNYNYLNSLKNMQMIYNRIKYVKFECQDFKKLLKRTDVSGALWYLDPPYFQGGQEYEKNIGGKEWNDQDFEDLLSILENVKHAKFVLSIDDKEYFNNSNWYYQEIERCNRCNPLKNKKRSKGIEYIVRNFDPSKTEVMKPINQTTLEGFLQTTTNARLDGFL